VPWLCSFSGNGIPLGEGCIPDGKGAVLAPSAAAAVTASPLILICVTNYAAANPW